MKVCRFVLICQLLEGQQNLVCFDRRRCVLTAELRLTDGAVLFLLAWGYTGGAISDFFVNSCHHIVVKYTLCLNSRHYVKLAVNLFCSSCHHIVAAKTFSLNSCYYVALVASLFCNSCHHVVAVACLFCNSCHHVVAVACLFVNSCHPVVAVACLFCNSCHHVVDVACLFVNTCHHEVAVFWARVLYHLVVEEARFRMRITLGVVLIRSLVCIKCVLRHIRSGYGMALN